jgi:hypothetical protein
MSEGRRLFARIAAIPALMSAALSGCATASGFSSQPNGVRLNAPTDGALASPVWMPDGYLYFIFLPNAAPPGQALTSSLWRVKPGGKAQRVRWNPSGVCPRADYGALTTLPDGRLGLDRTCLPGGTALPVDDLVALDTKTRVE